MGVFHFPGRSYPDAPGALPEISTYHQDSAIRENSVLPPRKRTRPTHSVAAARIWGSGQKQPAGMPAHQRTEGEGKCKEARLKIVIAAQRRSLTPPIPIAEDRVSGARQPCSTVSHQSQPRSM